MTTIQDRRDTTRSTDSVIVQLRLATGEVLNGKAVDVAEGGLRVRCGQLLPVDAVVAGRVPMRDRTAEVRLRVVWARRCGNAWEYGLRSVIEASGRQAMASFWLFRRALAEPSPWAA